MLTRRHLLSLFAAAAAAPFIPAPEPPPLAFHPDAFVFVSQQMDYADYRRQFTGVLRPELLDWSGDNRHWLASDELVSK